MRTAERVMRLLSFVALSLVFVLLCLTVCGSAMRNHHDKTVEQYCNINDRMPTSSLRGHVIKNGFQEAKVASANTALKITTAFADLHQAPKGTVLAVLAALFRLVWWWALAVVSFLLVLIDIVLTALFRIAYCQLAHWSLFSEVV
jgi:hypothetical protein